MDSPELSLYIWKNLDFHQKPIFGKVLRTKRNGAEG